VKVNCHYVIIETTSHAIAQYRNFGISYDIAVLTNVTHDHLDYHKTFENYMMTKAKLFNTGETINIINVDDRSAKVFAELPSKRTITYGTESPEKGRLFKPEVLGKKILIEASNSLVSVVTPIGQVAYNLQLPGKFNIYNALAATSVAVALGIHLDVVRQALEGIDVIPGRMEKIDLGQSFTVLIDYAHTPDALEKIYQTLEVAARARIIAVLGACGDRDRSKRPIMGALAGHYADIVIITNEDPYTEDPQKIIDEVASGVPRGATKENPMILDKNFFIMSSRRLAMEKAINLAYKDDIVIITGKGAEECMVCGTEKVPWSDRKIAKEILLKRIHSV
jgi:UDP-N-acetylmuramyl-tripeptide synthetase